MESKNTDTPKPPMSVRRVRRLLHVCPQFVVGSFIFIYNPLVLDMIFKILIAVSILKT